MKIRMLKHYRMMAKNKVYDVIDNIAINLIHQKVAEEIKVKKEKVKSKD